MSATSKPERPARGMTLGAAMVLLGCLTAIAGHQALSHWPSISAAFAACGVLWLAAGPVMLLAGLWALGSGDRRRLPLRIGAAASLLSGGIWIAGVFTYVIPCTGSN